MVKPTIQSHNISDSDLEMYATVILKGMKENSSIFPNPQPTMAEFEEVLLSFRKAITAAAYGDRLAIRIRNDKRKVLLFSLRALSFYVDLIARSDEAIILASGFIPSKSGDTSNKEIPNVEQLTAKPEIGTRKIKLSVKAWRLARMYQFEYRKKGSEEPWTIVMSSKSRCTISDLEVFQEYEFRARYFGRNAHSPYSSIISSYVY